VAWDATDERYEVSTVTVGGVADTCDGLTLSVTLADTGGAQIGAGLTSASAASSVAASSCSLAASSGDAYVDGAALQVNSNFGTGLAAGLHAQAVEYEEGVGSRLWRAEVDVCVEAAAGVAEKQEPAFALGGRTAGEELRLALEREASRTRRKASDAPRQALDDLDDRAVAS
jgi:hypothetical protein